MLTRDATILFFFYLLGIVIELSSCGARGKEGPKAADCLESYNNTDAVHSIRVIEDQLFKGVQVWRVPRENYYT